MQLYADEAQAFRRGRGDNGGAVNHHYGIEKARLQPQAIGLVPKAPRIVKPLNLPGAPSELTLRRAQITIGGVGELARIGDIILKQAVLNVALLKNQQRSEQ